MQQAHKEEEDQPPQVIVQPLVVEQSAGQVIDEKIDTDFEQGLHLIKGIASNPLSLDANSRELVFNKLLSIISTVCKNP